MYRDKRTVRYSSLRGVDFSCSASLVDRSHSPFCVNMMPDSSINPVKRPGWETVYSLDGSVHNIWFCTINGTKYALCHCGSRIYLLKDGTATVLKENVAGGKGCGFYATNSEKGYFYMRYICNYDVVFSNGCFEKNIICYYFNSVCYYSL